MDISLLMHLTITVISIREQKQVLSAIEAVVLTFSNTTERSAAIVVLPTKSVDKARDPDMHQTREGQQWYCNEVAHRCG